MTTLELANLFATRLDVVWTFLLLFTRYTGLFLMVPGIGEGVKGVVVRLPAVLVFSLVSLAQQVWAPIPANGLIVFAALVSELLFGVIIGFIPFLIVCGVQTGAQLASSAMGFGASQMIDPTTGGQVSDIGRLVGDLTVILFLVLGGHHVVLHAVAGFSGNMVPGSFVLGDLTMQLFIDRSADTLRVGVMIAAPITVALLLTQFVMGLISKAVPTFNIFILSFPITISIGLLLTILALPDMMRFVYREITGIENSVAIVGRDAGVE